MKITLEDFKNWLKSFEPDEVVGLAAVSDECPIANCYRQLYPRKRVDVYPDCIEVDGCSKSHAPWSEAFVKMVDLRGSYTPVTASEALRLLEELPHAT